MDENLREEFEGMMTKDEGKDLTDAVKLFSKGGNNIDLKSEVDNPLNLAMFNAIADFLEEKNFDQSKKVFKTIIDKLLRYRISYKRKSREEMSEALKSLRHEEKEEEREMMQKLLERGG